MTIGDKIKKKRLEKGMTQKKLGECSGIAEPTIRRYESGKLNPKKETIKKIADGLGVHPSELIGPEWFDMEAGPERLAELRDSVNTLVAVGKVFGESASDLLSKFSELNPSGQQKALDYVSDLTEQAKYQK